MTVSPGSNPNDPIAKLRSDIDQLIKDLDNNKDRSDLHCRIEDIKNSIGSLSNQFDRQLFEPIRHLIDRVKVINKKDADALAKSLKDVGLPDLLTQVQDVTYEIFQFLSPKELLQNRSINKELSTISITMAIEKINQHTPLYKLELTHDELINLIKNYGNNIQCLDFYNIHRDFTNRFFSEGLCKCCPNLTTLSFSSIDGASPYLITDKDLTELKILTNLQELNLAGSPKITDKGIAELKTLTSLQRLLLGWCPKITDKGIAELKTLTSLQELDLYGCIAITDKGIAELEALTSLRRLNLGKCWRITDKGIAELKTFTSLQELDLSECSETTDEGLAALKALTSLRCLDLGKCSRITDKGIAALQALTSLQRLYLSDCPQITDEELVKLKALTSLQELDLYGCSEITDEGLAALKTLTSLQELNLAWCPKITNKGIAELLKALTNLQTLYLTGCSGITDERIAALKALTRSQDLNIIR